MSALEILLFAVFGVLLTWAVTAGLRDKKTNIPGWNIDRSKSPAQYWTVMTLAILMAAYVDVMAIIGLSRMAIGARP